MTTEENRFKIVILSPTQTLLNQNVVFAVVPGSEGEFGILANHAPFIVTLKEGLVKIYRDNQQTISEEIKITGGFANIQNNVCQLLING
ncbi:F0F1 ATP synthase subunit epsilon [Candidatus Paracaedibacter symbiosus]|uniref:F0F1 ATP synthase subunit epsilon n=1 Tax=Candidatus Paracaedibacter symbiosus TaxID=244582 RepID=UPI00050966E0|nr:hypothetical protein [Candidatus Paracaedibacter symbiosus]